MNSGTHASFGFQRSAFQKEFAEFVGFIGGDVIDSAVRRVEAKLAALTPLGRTLYGERFYFHHQWVKFLELPSAIQLDTSDIFAVRAASLIAGINRVRPLLSEQGATHLSSMVRDNLSPDRDVRQIEHEIRCFTHLKNLGLDVDFADLDQAGDGKKFDLLVKNPTVSVEVECKTVTGDTSKQIKTDLAISLSEAFRASVGKNRLVAESGFYVLTFLKPVSACREPAKQLIHLLLSDDPTIDTGPDFSISFSQKPQWHNALKAERIPELRQMVAADFGEDTHCTLHVGDHLVGIVFRPHKPSNMIEAVAKIIRSAGKQCTATRPCMVWLHFVGMQQPEFRAIADLSSDGRGQGLCATLAKALQMNSGPDGLSHLERSRFSADPDELSRRPILGPDFMLRSAVSADGLVYDVRNPHCRFPPVERL